MQKKYKYILILLVIFVIILCIWTMYSTNKNKINHLITNNAIKHQQNIPIKDIEGYASVDDSYNSPYILNNVLTPSQCNQIMLMTKNNLVDSSTVGGYNKKVRNSMQTWISKKDPLVQELYNKLSLIVGIPTSHAEDLQVVRYLPGQYYNEHHDACCTNDIRCSEFIKKGGQRMLTVLIYLNSDFEGGSTRFPNLNTDFKPNVGSAIVFHPLANNTSKCHPLALHAGTPVTSGEKWIANIWFRENIFYS